MGHFTKVCLKRRRFSKSIATVLESEIDSDSSTDTEQVLAVTDEPREGNPSTCRDPKVDILVGNKTVNLLVDSGAKITMITQALFRHKWGDRPLSPPDRCPVSYEGQKIDLLGYFEDTMEFRGRRIKGKVYVAVKGLDILGWYHQGLFRMILKTGAKEQVLVVGINEESEKWKAKYPKVFGESLGKIKGFKHKIRIKDNAIPVKHKLRGVPLNIRDDLESELKDLCQKGIIEPIESSLWLSPLVVTRKKNGQLRVCVDLRSLNKEIWIAQNIRIICSNNRG